jgi:dihydrofolate synthase/folylpolyglutamate synthase
MQPTVIVDAAHNWAAIAALLKTLGDFSVRRRVLVFAGTQDKDVGGMLRQLLPMFDSVIVTSYLNNPRAVAAEELSRQAAQLTEAPIHLTHDPVSAWKLARRLAAPEDLICITGSFFIAAEMRDVILETTDEDNSASIRDDIGQRR